MTKKFLTSFKDASLLAQRWAQEIGASVHLEREGDAWAVILRTEANSMGNGASLPVANRLPSMDNALRIIQSLVDGIDPCTGEMFPNDSPYQQPAILRALFIAVRALEHIEEKQKREQRVPENAGKAWDKAEDRMLCIGFESGLTIRQLAQKHLRTLGAIQARLEKLGKIPLFEPQDKLLASALEREKQEELEKHRNLEEIRELYEGEDEDEETAEDEYWDEEQFQNYLEVENAYWDEEQYQTNLEVQDELIDDRVNYARSEEEGWFYSDSGSDDWCDQYR